METKKETNSEVQIKEVYSSDNENNSKFKKVKKIFINKILPWLFLVIVVVGWNYILGSKNNQKTPPVMSSIETIQEFLPENFQSLAMEYKIPETMLEKDTDLVVLILESEALKNSEAKQEWFDLYPMMSQDKIDNLYDILTREKEKLTEIYEGLGTNLEALREEFKAELRKEPIYDPEIHEELLDKFYDLYIERVLAAYGEGTADQEEIIKQIIIDISEELNYPITFDTTLDSSIETE